MTPKHLAPFFCVILAASCAAPGDVKLAAPVSPPSAAFEPGACEVGIYRAGPDAFAAITRFREGFSYTFHGGRRGTIGTPEAALECGGDSVRINTGEIWHKVAVRETDTRFRSGDAMLAGRLIEAPGANGETALVVYAHGSEDTAWIERARDPYQMVGRGISVFVYDKRGTGQSEGRYSQNFPQLGDDLVAASQEAKRLAGSRFGRFGLVGLGQGGWIAPLAANRAQADFIAIGYGLVADIREEDAAQVRKELHEACYGPDVLAAARRITDVTARIAASDYTDGLEELAALQQQFSGEPWFELIKGSYSGVFVGMSADELRTNGVPQFNDLDIDWTLDPMQVMRGVEAPQLWVLAGEDREAPLELSLDRLSALRKEGRDITIYIFPDTDHGMLEFAQQPDGTRRYGRVTQGFYDLIADWVQGEELKQYGKAYRSR